MNVLIDFVNRLVATNTDDIRFGFEVFDNGHAGVFESLESLLDGLDVVVTSATGLTTFQQPLEHDVFGAVEEQDELAFDDVPFK